MEKFRFVSLLLALMLMVSCGDAASQGGDTTTADSSGEIASTLAANKSVMEDELQKYIALFE